jgi:hypothetical protein
LELDVERGVRDSVHRFLCQAYNLGERFFSAPLFQTIFLNTVLIFFSAVSFLGYGTACFFWGHMKQEFLRYGLGSQRLLVGILQCLAGMGLLVGMRQPWIGQAAAGGLALMMLVAVVVRFQIKDSLLQTLPALLYLGLNAYLMLVGF